MGEVSCTFLAFQSVGVVYGDLGTSPLYTFANIFTDNPSEQDVVGATSLIVWTLISLVAIKYAIIVLRADDAGNGAHEAPIVFVFECIIVLRSKIICTHSSDLDSIQ